MQLTGQRAIYCRVIAALIAIAWMTACASGHREPFDAEAPVQRRDLGDLQPRLAAAGGLHLQSIGQVEYGRFSAPLWLLALPASSPDRPRILLNAGIHGNEPAGVDCAIGLAAAWAADPAVTGGAAVDIIPVVNPWGWVHDIRFNHDGIDINRDFAGRRSQEARLIADFLKNRSYDLVVDLHEDPGAGGFYLYQYGLADKSDGERVVAAIRAMGYPIEEEVSMVALKTVNGIIDAPMWGIRYMQLTRQLSMANYCRLYNSGRVFTVETPTRLTPADRLKIHRTAVDMLMNTAVGRQPK